MTLKQLWGFSFQANVLVDLFMGFYSVIFNRLLLRNKRSFEEAGCHMIPPKKGLNLKGVKINLSIFHLVV